MHYFEGYSFFLRGPKWVVNLLLGAVCVLVPIAGPMVLMGWVFEVMEKQRNRARYRGPVFNVNRLGTYLMRGLWPFLVQLVVGIPVAMVLIFAWMMLVMRVGFAAARGGGPWLFFPIFAGNFACFILVFVLVQMISLPMCLRAGILQDFGSAFHFSWAIDFIKRVWPEMILAMLFFLVTAPFIMLLGLLLCCVGFYPASALISMAHYHIWFQLYDLFLQRGGEPALMQVEPADTRIYPADDPL